MRESSKPRGLFIGEMSRRTGVNIETIRYYERIGVMPRPVRSEGGHRVFSDEQLRRLSFIKRSRELGFSLSEIRAMLRLVDEGTLTCAEIHAMTSVHLKAVHRKISDLRRLERVLQSMVAECTRGEVPDCPIIDALYAAV